MFSNLSPKIATIIKPKSILYNFSFNYYYIFPLFRVISYIRIK